MFGFLLWKFVVFVVCGLPSFVYSCLFSVCWCGCVSSSGLVVGFLGLLSLLRCNSVPVRVFPLSFRVSCRVMVFVNGVCLACSDV